VLPERQNPLIDDVHRQAMIRQAQTALLWLFSSDSNPVGGLLMP